jgi:lipid II:glycine glycyltransferase (peptidoglycan interpeptide bridge formation enzyme)
MSKNWRKHLNKAEKRGLAIIEGTDDCLFDNVHRLYGELLSRKRFEPGIKIEEYRKLQNILPNSFKMHIMVCEHEKRPIAGLVGSSIGDAGIELIAATGDDGLELGGSYLLRWKMLEYLKNSGCQYYNLNGINPERNPGGYQFKSGLCAKNGLDVKFLGTFEAYKGSLSHFAVGMGEMLRKSYNKINRFLR